MLLNEETRNRPVIENLAAETGAEGKVEVPSAWKRFLTALLRAFAVAVA
jgi:hypothetical protein